MAAGEFNVNCHAYSAAIICYRLRINQDTPQSFDYSNQFGSNIRNPDLRPVGFYLFRGDLPSARLI